jgi:alkylated DNA repair protein alkB family protein 7
MKVLLLIVYVFFYFRNLTRFDFTHEILKDQESYFNHIHIPRNRRISIMCRNMPLDPSAG